MISIKKYNHKLQYVWDDFIEKSNNGTIFHKQTFLNYHIDRKFQNHSLLFYQKNILICVLPAALVSENKVTTLYSHPGASYGGLIYKKLNFQLSQKIIIALEKYCIKHDIAKCTLRQTPLIYHKTYSACLDYVLHLRGFVAAEHYISHYLSLNLATNPLLYLQKRKQRYIKSDFLYNDDFTFAESDQLDEFYKILKQNKKKFNTSPTHSLKELQYLLKNFNQQIKLFVSYYKHKIMGGVLLFFTTENTCLIFYNVVANNASNKNISLYQIYRCIEYCVNNAFNVLDFGVSHLPNEQNPLLPKLSLIKFKEQFGCEGAIRLVYEKIFINNE